MNELDNTVSSWYRNYYNQICVTAHDSIFSKYTHKSLERRHKSNQGLKILEVGGHTGEHVIYVEKSYDKYLITDIQRISAKLKSELKYDGIDFAVANVENLNLKSETFDRVISTCLFHHLVDPYKAAIEIKRVTKPGGIISILIPTDPGFCYRILQYLTSGIKAKRANLYSQMELVHAIEHRNHFLGIKNLLSRAFQECEIKFTYYPFRIPSYNLNAFTILTIKKL